MQKKMNINNDDNQNQNQDRWRFDESLETASDVVILSRDSKLAAEDPPRVLFVPRTQVSF